MTTQPKSPPDTTPRTGWLRGIVLLYALAVLVATLWPALKVTIADLDRPDLLLHVGAFGTLAGLVTLAHWFGPRASARNALCSALACAVFAAVDELSQLIPSLHRTSAWDDFLANLLGVALGTLSAWGLRVQLAQRKAVNITHLR